MACVCVPLNQEIQKLQGRFTDLNLNQEDDTSLVKADKYDGRNIFSSDTLESESRDDSKSCKSCVADRENYTTREQEESSSENNPKTDQSSKERTRSRRRILEIRLKLHVSNRNDDEVDTSEDAYETTEDHKVSVKPSAVRSRGLVYQSSDGSLHPTATIPEVQRRSNTTGSLVLIEPPRNEISPTQITGIVSDQEQTQNLKVVSSRAINSNSINDSPNPLDFRSHQRTENITGKLRQPTQSEHLLWPHVISKSSPSTNFPYLNEVDLMRNTICMGQLNGDSSSVCSKLPRNTSKGAIYTVSETSDVISPNNHVPITTKGSLVATDVDPCIIQSHRNILGEGFQENAYWLAESDIIIPKSDGYPGSRNQGLVPTLLENTSFNPSYHLLPESKRIRSPDSSLSATSPNLFASSEDGGPVSVDETMTSNATTTTAGDMRSIRIRNEPFLPNGEYLRASSHTKECISTPHSPLPYRQQVHDSDTDCTSFAYGAEMAQAAYAGCCPGTHNLSINNIRCETSLDEETNDDVNTDRQLTDLCENILKDLHYLRSSNGTSMNQSADCDVPNSDYGKRYEPERPAEMCSNDPSTSMSTNDQVSLIRSPDPVAQISTPDPVAQISTPDPVAQISSPNPVALNRTSGLTEQLCAINHPTETRSLEPSIPTRIPDPHSQFSSSTSLGGQRTASKSVAQRRATKTSELVETNCFPLSVPMNGHVRTHGGNSGGIQESSQFRSPISHRSIKSGVHSRIRNTVTRRNQPITLNIKYLQCATAQALQAVPTSACQVPVQNITVILPMVMISKRQIRNHLQNRFTKILPKPSSDPD